MKLVLHVVSLLCCGVSLLAHGAQIDPRSTSGFYRITFGEVSQSESGLAKRAADIFAKIVRVADKAEYKDPELLVVDSPNWPWAIALPDNTVVLSRGALQLCYEEVSDEEGDIRLAMILGHELGHLAEDDYWHRDVYLGLQDHRPTAGDATLKLMNFIGERSGLVDAHSQQWLSIVKERELRADDWGFMYSALAGFDPTKLVENKERSFFHFWTEKTNALMGETPNYFLLPQDRSEYISARSRMLSDLSVLYRLGTVLTHMNHFDQARIVLKKVLSLFPAHEAYNNLGYLNLMQVAPMMNEASPYPFWLFAISDAKPKTRIITRGMDQASEVDAEAYLATATKYFMRSIKHNPGYLPGYLNLATVYFYQQKYARATAVLRDAQAIAPNNTEIESMLQLTTMESLVGLVNYLPQAIKNMERLWAQPEAPLSAAFNLAQLYDRANETDKANEIWQQVVKSFHQVPSSLRTHVRDRIEVAEDQSVARNQYQRIRSFMKTTTPSISRKTQREILEIPIDGQATVQIRTLSYGQDLRINPENSLAKIWNIPADLEAADLIECCGKPKEIRTTSRGAFWVYGNRWYILVRDQIIAEVWEDVG